MARGFQRRCSHTALENGRYASKSSARRMVIGSECPDHSAQNRMLWGRQAPDCSCVSLQLNGLRTNPCHGVLLEALFALAPNRLGAVQVQREKSPLARTAGHSEWQRPQESREIWQGAGVPA